MSEPGNARKLEDVPSDAHRRTGLLERWQFWAPVALVVLLVGWRVADHAWPALPGATWHSPGPVANVHAAWDHDCQACHIDFQPISSADWLALAQGTTHAADAKCQACHAGAAHHTNEKVGETAACASCHREHFGRDGVLLHVADDQCSRCHSNLAQHHADTLSRPFENVTGFPTGHPEFRVLRDKSPDPGRLKFNHARHMTPGLGSGLTLDKLGEEYRDQYRTAAGPDAPLTLQCSSCHQLDAGDLTMKSAQLNGLPLSPLSPPRAAGATMLPVVFEKHCRACHELKFGVNTLPHRIAPADVEKYLKAFFIDRDLPLTPRDKAEPDDLRVPLPGKGAEPLSAKLRDQVALAERELFRSRKGCAECHVLEPDPESKLIDPSARVTIAPTKVKDVWFEDARFDHTSHRWLNCTECHAAKDSPAAEKLRPETLTALDPSALLGDMLMPSVAKCAECHAPRSGNKGGVRHDCVACHRYHDGEHRLSGRGAASGRSSDQGDGRTVQQFLDGLK